jgi:hypothetical protein
MFSDSLRDDARCLGPREALSEKSHTGLIREAAEYVCPKIPFFRFSIQV